MHAVVTLWRVGLAQLRSVPFPSTSITAAEHSIVADKTRAVTSCSCWLAVLSFVRSFVRCLYAGFNEFLVPYRTVRCHLFLVSSKGRRIEKYEMNHTITKSVVRLLLSISDDIWRWQPRPPHRPPTTLKRQADCWWSLLQPIFLVVVVVAVPRLQIERRIDQ